MEGPPEPTLAAETKPSTAPGLNSFPQCNQHGCRKMDVMEGPMAFCFIFFSLRIGVVTYSLWFEPLCDLCWVLYTRTDFMGLFRTKNAKLKIIILLWREWAGNHGKTFQYSVAISVLTYKALQNQLLPLKVHQQQHQAGGFGKPQQTKCYPSFIGLFLNHILYRLGCLHFIGRDSGILERIEKDWKGFLAFDLTVAPGKIV